MSARGQKFTVAWKTPVYYSDFLDTFATNPTTGALATVTNEDAISQAIQNLVETSPGERPGRNAIGSKVLSTLFDLATPASITLVGTTVKNVIQNYEPRATDVSVDVDTSDIMNNAVTVTVTYRPINLPQTVTFSFTLSRVR